MAGIKDYSPTPASNTALFPEGMAPSAVNDGMRQVQADVRDWFNDAEWILYGDGDGAFTLTYASATSFTVAGANVTGKYHAGRRVRAVGTLIGTIYGTISSSSFSTNTVVDVEWDSGSLQNEAITVYLGILSATNQVTPPITGEIRMWAAAAAPTGWLLCQGQAISRTTFARLFALIGTSYGAGDGSATFNVPDMRGRAPIGVGQGSGLSNRALAAQVGAETHALSQAETPVKSHTHGVTDTGHNHGVFFSNLAAGGGANRTVATSAESGSTAGTSNATTGISIQAANDATASAHNNMQPSLAVNFIIKT